LFFTIFACQTVSGQNISEDFADIEVLLANGWFTVNHSDPLNPSVEGWSQCGGTAIPPAHMGAPTACVLVNYQSGKGEATLNNWLGGPVRTFHNGDTISFYTRTPNNNFPDRLQLRLSTSGASTDVGTGAFDVGVFTTLLLDINPNYQPIYPTVWTQFSVTLSGLPSGGASGRFAFRYFVEHGGPDGVNSNIIGVDTLAYTANALTPAAHQESDYDGDGRTDLSVARNTGGGAGGQVTWYNRRSSDGALYAAPWGIATDFIAPDDYDNDNKTDIAVWRQGPPGVAAYYIFYTGTSTMSSYQFGQTGDNPDVHRDYDGDGKADIAVYRPGATTGAQSFWFYRGSLNNPSGNITYVPWGIRGDFPAPGDYNHDGRGDFVVQRDNGGGQARFYRLFSNGTTDTLVFGFPTDAIVPGDYDGDGSTDIAVVRDSGGLIYWYVRNSSNGAIVGGPFGNSPDIVCQGDYDGDGRTDFAVWRPSADPTMNFFYWLGSTSGFAGAEWGQLNDVPGASWNTH